MQSRKAQSNSTDTASTVSCGQPKASTKGVVSAIQWKTSLFVAWPGYHPIPQYRPCVDRSCTKPSSSGREQAAQVAGIRGVLSLTKTNLIAVLRTLRPSVRFASAEVAGI